MLIKFLKVFILIAKEIVIKTGIYENISGYGLTKGEFNPETGYSSFEITLKYTK